MACQQMCGESPVIGSNFTCRHSRHTSMALPAGIEPAETLEGEHPSPHRWLVPLTPGNNHVKLRRHAQPSMYLGAERSPWEGGCRHNLHDSTAHAITWVHPHEPQWSQSLLHCGIICRIPHCCPVFLLGEKGSKHACLSPPPPPPPPQVSR